jgi:hypothetical protein
MNINVKVNQRPWPYERIFRDLSSRLNAPATIGITDEGSFHLMAGFDGQEVTFMESVEDSEGNTHFMVAKELGPLRFLLSFNLAQTGAIDLTQQSNGFSSSWPEWTFLLVASDFDDPIIVSRIPSDSISSAEALEEFVLHTFLEDFEEKAKKDILHSNKVVWRSVWMGSIFGVLLIGFIILILSLIFSFGPLWSQVLLVVILVVGHNVGFEEDDDDDDDDC